MNRRQRCMCECGISRGFCMSKEKRGQAMTMRGAEIMSRRTEHAL